MGKGNWDGERSWKLEKGSRGPQEPGKDIRDGEKIFRDWEITLSGPGKGPWRTGKKPQGPGKDTVGKKSLVDWEKNPEKWEKNPQLLGKDPLSQEETLRNWGIPPNNKHPNNK